MKSYKKLLYILFVASCIQGSIFASGKASITLNVPDNNHRYEIGMLYGTSQDAEYKALVKPSKNDPTKYSLPTNNLGMTWYAIYKDGKMLNNKHTAESFQRRGYWIWTIDKNDKDTLTLKEW